MNQEKLSKMAAQVRIGGTARRKKKVIRRSSTTDDKKLQSSLKKLSVNNISGIEEVNMIKEDGSVIHFNNPKVQASLNANTFAISGHADNKQIADMLPGILNHLGSEGFNQLKRLASTAGPTDVNPGAMADEEDDVPELVEDFEEASKKDSESKLAEEEGKENLPVKAKKPRRKKKKNAAKTESNEDSSVDATSPTEKEDADADDEDDDEANEKRKPKKDKKLKEKNSESKAE